MKFWVKVFLATVAVMAAAFGAIGYALVTASFQSTLSREEQRALESGRMVQVVLEANAQIYTSQTSLPDDGVLGALMERVATGDFATARLYGRDYGLIWGKQGEPPLDLLQGAAYGQAHVIRQEGETYWVETATPVTLAGRACLLYTRQDVSWVFQQQDAMFQSCAIITALALGIAAVIMAAVCGILTQPIRQLSLATKKIAAGEYGKRAPVMSRDEVGALTRDFNTMADALEKHIEELKEEARRREDFVASFAHELKTPLTSIIGYADMLRSQELPPERAFSCANYIFKEGRRLESLSLKLLELIVLERQSFPTKPANGRLLCESAAAAAGPALKQKYGVILQCHAQDGIVLAEPDLLITLLVNLLDNAAKASVFGQSVLLQGKVEDNDYVFQVADTGRGIPQEELQRITEAFYMVDKSRARQQSGAGLGLALAAQIARLHGTQLAFASELNKGTTAKIALALASGEEAHG